MAAAKVYLEQGLVTDISLDHDMGACPACTATGRHIGRMTRRGNTFYDYCSHVPSGYDLCLWMEQTGRWPRGSVRVHSANPVGARRMREVVERAGRESVSPPLSAPTGHIFRNWGNAAWRLVAQIGTALVRRRTSTKS